MGGVETKPETLLGRRGDETWNPKPFRVSNGGVLTKPETLRFQTGEFKPNSKPFRVPNGRGMKHETRNPLGFQTGVLNQTWNPFGFQTEVKTKPQTL